jgi:hypothetical protein
MSRIVSITKWDELISSSREMLAEVEAKAKRAKDGYSGNGGRAGCWRTLAGNYGYKAVTPLHGNQNANEGA